VWWWGARENLARAGIEGGRVLLCLPPLVNSLANVRLACWAVEDDATVPRCRHKRADQSSAGQPGHRNMSEELNVPLVSMSRAG
jgi:hypothetical protein